MCKSDYFPHGLKSVEHLISLGFDRLKFIEKDIILMVQPGFQKDVQPVGVALQKVTVECATKNADGNNPSIGS